MFRAIRPVRHEEHLSLVEHLDELRTRLIISLAALAVAFAFCFWQNHTLISVLNGPVKKQVAAEISKGRGTEGQIATAWRAIRNLGAVEKTVVAALRNPANGLPAGARHALGPLEQQITAAYAKVPRTDPPNVPTTLGIGEPFTATVTVTFYFALLLSLPIILFELYGFLIPAFSPTERSVALPVMVAVPGLFAGGVAFGYFVVLPAAVHFLQNFNSSNFNVQLLASSYYQFAALIMLAMGVIFQVPLGVIAVARAGIVTPRQLRKNRRYAIVVAAAIAALLPGDVVTMTLETLPIIVLYEVGILVVAALDRRDVRRAHAHERSASAGAPPPPPPPIPSNDAL
jgi:sec-independent protein translocase protein TatC